MRKHLLKIIAMMILAIFVLAACGGGDATEAPTEDTGTTETGGGEESLEGKTVTVLGAVIDQDEDRFLESIKPFEEATGIDVVYEGSGDFEQLATLRVEGGNPPDVMMFPQPGLMADLARAGSLVDLGSVINISELADNYSDAWIDLGSVDGTLYGVWYRASLKSLVWYPVPEFEEAGYAVPTTWDEMLALSDQIVADGGTPWCIGMESATATGWVGTDWIEDIMLRTAGGDAYDQWVAGELLFNSPEVSRAFEVAGEIFFNPDYVLGGTTSILTTPFGDSPTPMFDDPPGCYMHRQASFITGFFPEDVQADLGANVNAFYLPPIDADKGNPVLGAGDVFAITSDRPEVQEFIKFITTSEAAESWAKAGGFLSPNSSVPLDWYPNEITRVQAEILTGADVFRFDASDLMPGAVGTGSFWTEIVNWVSGKDLDATLDAIDSSWPERTVSTDTGGETDEPDLAGTTVTVLGAVIDQDEDRFLESIKPFEEATGVEVVYEGSGDFEQLATLRVEGGNPPDVMMFPQPGLMADLARQGNLVPISSLINVPDLAKRYSGAWIDLGSVDGDLYGVWYRASLKSLVWYPVPEFEEAGYAVPTTWDEMLALSDQIVADGGTPWCIGMESATATGWVGTDWIEDIMLRTAGGEAYDQWVAGDLDFDSPEVRRAFEVAGEIFFNPDYVLGGTTSILTTPFGDAPTPMFDDPPSCYMHRQASFITGFFPEDVQADLGANVNAFYLPPIDADKGNPVLGAGDVFAITSDRPEVVAFLDFISSGEAAESWAKAGGFLSPNKDVSLDWYPNEITRVQAEILTGADVFRFDASDLMPGAVGTGSFWTEIVNWVSGQDLDATLQAIDSSWPQ